MTPDELASRRWFRSKQRPIAAVTEVDRAPIGPGVLVVLEVTFDDDGGPERYLAPVVDGREPADGDGLWAALAEAIARGERIGSFVATRAAGTELGSLTERHLSVEQSNTSIVLGERLILKLYRLLEPGDNPDVEVGAFLAEVGFADTPAFAGWMDHGEDGDRASAAMLQAFVPAAGDAWTATLAALASDPADGVRMSARIGDLTARLHGALASRTQASAFPSRAATVDDTAEWRASAERQLALAV